jgi:putative copper export protein
MAAGLSALLRTTYGGILLAKLVCLAPLAQLGQHIQIRMTGIAYGVAAVLSHSSSWRERTPR